jgi:hypothetical protein
MPDHDAGGSRFAAAFPARFADVIADARGAIAGIRSSAHNGGGGALDPDRLRCLHEIYRLRIELEIEAASVLWRTAELVCSLTDAVEVVNRRRQPTPIPPEEWLPGIPEASVALRRGRSQMTDDLARRRTRWPDLSAPAAIDAGRVAARSQYLGNQHPENGAPPRFGGFAERPSIDRRSQWAGIQEVDEAA